MQPIVLIRLCQPGLRTWPRSFCGSSRSVLACNRKGEGYCWRMHRAGPPWHHIRPEGLRTGGPQLTAGHGRPVCQPWWNGDKAEGQHPSDVLRRFSPPQILQSTAPDEPFLLLFLAALDNTKRRMTVILTSFSKVGYAHHQENNLPA